MDRSCENAEVIAGNNVFYIKGQYIMITYHDILISVAHEVLEHYDKPENQGTLISINVTHPDIVWDALNLNDYPKKIFYNAEQYCTCNFSDGSQRYFYGNLFPYIEYHKFDLIWDFLIEDFSYVPNNLKGRFRFMPFRYCSCMDDYRDKITSLRNQNPPRYDLFFSGTHDTDVRHQVITTIQGWNPETNIPSTKHIKFITSTGYDNFNNYDLQAMARFTLDYPHYSLEDQTQSILRVYDMVMAGNCVIGYVNPKYLNYFEDIIIPVSGTDPNELAGNIIKVCNCVTPFYDGWDKFRSITETDEAFNRYREYQARRWVDLSGEWIPELVLFDPMKYNI